MFSPDDWGTMDAVLRNNFSQLTGVGRDGAPWSNEGKASYCVPIIAPRAMVYDVQQRATPQMDAAGVEPGHKMSGEAIAPSKDIHVVVIDGAGGAQNAASSREDVLWTRVAVRAHVAGDSDASTIGARVAVAKYLFDSGRYSAALRVARQAVDDARAAAAAAPSRAADLLLADALQMLGRCKCSAARILRVVSEHLRAAAAHREALGLWSPCIQARREHHDFRTLPVLPSLLGGREDRRILRARGRGCQRRRRRRPAGREIREIRKIRDICEVHFHDQPRSPWDPADRADPADPEDLADLEDPADPVHRKCVCVCVWGVYVPLGECNICASLVAP